MIMKYSRTRSLLVIFGLIALPVSVAQAKANRPAEAYPGQADYRKALASDSLGALSKKLLHVGYAEEAKCGLKSIETGLETVSSLLPFTGLVESEVRDWVGNSRRQADW